jgi:methionine synthase I (cobalamin-dependent)
MSRLAAALRSGNVLLMDGAMGTELMRRGLRAGECADAWNLTRPNEVRAVHHAYLDAGAEILLTNTFQANPCALARHGLQDELEAIWQAAFKNARGAPLLLADVGPMERFAPEELARILQAARTADGILLETWSSFADLKTVAHLNRETENLPLLVSFTFRRADGLTTFPGASPESCAEAAIAADAVALGANCGAEIDTAALLEIIERFRAVCDLPLFVRPNAGTPNGEAYPRSPEAMAEQLRPLLQTGVTMVGGCCGTTPEHTAAFRRVIDDFR